MLQRPRILVVDHDERLLIALEKLLEDEGFDTATTWEWDEAVELLREHQFDWIIVGDHPPDLQASKVLRQVREMRTSSGCLVLCPERSARKGSFGPPGATAVVSRHSYSEIVQLITVLMKERFTAQAKVEAA